MRLHKDLSETHAEGHGAPRQPTPRQCSPRKWDKMPPRQCAMETIRPGDNVPQETICPGRQYALVYNVLWYTMCPGIQCALEDNAPQKIWPIKKLPWRQCSCFALVGPSWPPLAPLCPSWPCLAQFGPIYICFAPFYPVWPSLVLCCPVWPVWFHFAPFEQNFGPSNGLAVSRRSGTVNTVSGPLFSRFFSTFLFLFAITILSNRTAPWIKTLI